MNTLPMMTNYGEARQIIELELYEWEKSLEHERENRHDFEEAFGISRYDSIINHVRTIRGLRKALSALDL